MRLPRSIAVAAVLLTGCALLQRPDPQPGGGATVALTLEGSAIGRPGVREEVTRRLTQISGRRVVVVDGQPDPQLAERAARLGKTVPAARKYGTREPKCAKEHAIGAAVVARADAVFRVRLDYTESSRRATAEERAQGPAGAAGVLAAVGLGARDSVLEEKLEGSVERASFDGKPTARRRIARTERHVAPNKLTKRLDAADVGESLAVAFDELLPAPAPKWDAVGRRLVTNGCPLLAIAVEEALVRDESAKKKLRATAVAAITRRVAPAKAEPVPQETTPEPPADDAAEAQALATAPEHSCRELCDMHMVELCNNDRALWTQHRATWESTRCGLRRSETFLESCYRMHWLDGTYERACLQPCESSADGRQRLVMLLRRSGCLRAGV